MDFLTRLFAPAVLLCAVTLNAGTAHAGDNKLTLLYADLAPYVTASSDGAQGYLADHLEAVAKGADVELEWSYMPWYNQMALLKRAPGNVCAAALFATEARREFLVFTEAIGKDYGMVVVVRKSDKRIGGHRSLVSLLDDARLKGIVQVDTSYGPYVDPLLKGRDLMVASTSTPRTLRNLAAGVGDFLIVTKPTVEHLIVQYNLGDQLAIIADLTDMQDDIFFYIGCTKSTDGEALARLNRELLRMGPVCPDGPCR
ncbi:substrate-binding periplasmic protein [Kordiimonas lipolytica]|uniref:Substrate-binding periplasmic protein n=1 Tax=Kordiimonas lipolytica TaxID=1662421 RepID=A0ABV8UFH6_9PROT|nr:transporter substrate-binding domain-containing protein [Kordiimonas lipolytica]